MKSSQSPQSPPSPPSKEDPRLLETRNRIVKEASEFSTLSGTDVGLIMYHPHDPKPDVWCSKPGSIHTLLGKYLSEGSSERSAVKTSSDKDETKFIDGLGVDELRKLDGFLAEKLNEVNERINKMKGNQSGSTTVTDGSPEGPGTGPGRGGCDRV